MGSEDGAILISILIALIKILKHVSPLFDKCERDRVDKQKNLDYGCKEQANWFLMKGAWFDVDQSF